LTGFSQNEGLAGTNNYIHYIEKKPFFEEAFRLQHLPASHKRLKTHSLLIFFYLFLLFPFFIISDRLICV